MRLNPVTAVCCIVFACLATTQDLTPTESIVGIAADQTGQGYWLVAQDGRVFAFNGASLFGSINATLNAPVVGIAATPDGQGYWLVASDGGVFAFGDAGFYGSTGNIHLNGQITGMSSTTSGRGYWLLGADGGVFAFGDAPFYGAFAPLPNGVRAVGIINIGNAGYAVANSDSSTAMLLHGSGSGIPPVVRPVAPVVGFTSDPSQKSGYCQVASDGGVFTIGQAPYCGSLAGDGGSTVVGIAAMYHGKGYGYLLARANGSVYAYTCPMPVH